MDEAAGPRGAAAGSEAGEASAGAVSPESSPSATVPLGIASFFEQDPDDRPALLLLRGEPEGAGRAAVALAESLARSGHRIVLCDLSLSSPELHRILDVPNDEGMTDLFEFGASLRRVTIRVRDGSLFFAPAGVGVSDPERIAGHPRWNRLLEGAAEAGATLLLYVPASLPGVDRIARRVPAAAVIGTDADAEAAAESLPDGCPLLDLIPVSRAETTWPASGGGVAAGAEPREEFEAEAGARDEADTDPRHGAADGDAFDEALANFRPFDDEGPRTEPEAPQDAGDVAATAAVTDGVTDAAAPPPVELRSPVPAVGASAAVTSPAGSAPDTPHGTGGESARGGTMHGTAGDTMRGPSGGALHRPAGDAPATPSGADGTPVDADAAPAAVAHAVATEDGGGDVDRGLPPARVGVWIALGVAVVLLLLALIFLRPPANAEPAAPGAETASPEEPAVVEGAIPAAPAHGEIVPLAYTVAIEAHPDLGTARNRLERLRGAEEGMPFLITPFPLEDGDVVYRVMAGPYGDSAEAVVVRDVLYADGRKATASAWDVRPAAFGFLLDERETMEGARARAEELTEAGIPAYTVSIAPDGAARIYAGVFSLREQASVLAGRLSELGLDPPLVRISGWVPTP